MQMIIDVSENTLEQIRNPILRSYAGIYVNIYQDFLHQISQVGIEIDETDYNPLVKEKIDTLQKRGAIVRNDSKSIYINAISPACIACQKGIGTATFFISLKCNRHCFFCFNPNQEKFEYFRNHVRDINTELDNIKSKGMLVKHLALTGGEPLMHKEETISFFDRGSKDFPDAYNRLYTNGDYLNIEILDSLKKAGLDEIRISIRIEDLENG